MVPFRGNVETRLRKLDAGEVDATLLALAGLKRLGLADEATAVLTLDEFIPAVGQGDHRHRDARRRCRDARGWSRPSITPDTGDGARRRARFSRRARWLLPHADRRPRHRQCRAHLHFRGLIAKPDGSEVFETARAGAAGDAAALGADAGGELKSRAGADFFMPV